MPGDPTSYLLDGKPTKMGHTTVSVKYGARPSRHTFYTTHWGPVVDVPAVPGNAYIWNTSTAYALYDAVAPVGPRAADQYFRMGQATSVKNLYDIEAKWLAIPTFNTIAADDRGNAYYGDVGATPAVSQAEINACLPPGLPTLVFQQARVSRSTARAARVRRRTCRARRRRGSSAPNSLPHLFRRDYVENSNDSFWLANPSHPLTGFSPIIGLTGIRAEPADPARQRDDRRPGQRHRRARRAEVHDLDPAADVGGRPLRARLAGAARSWSPTAGRTPRRSRATGRRST